MKQRKLIQKVKRFLAGVIVVAMAVTMLPTVPITATETQEAYPYTLFAGSNAEGAITVKGNACVNGKIATNGTAVFLGSSNNINGTITEHAGESLTDISAKLDKIYFMAENVEHVSGNYISEEVNCNISKPVNVQGTVEVKGNVNLNAPLKAAGDITVKADSLNANNAVLYSKEGDIFITGNNVSFTGLLYAPNGDIRISAQNVNLNSVVVLADTITLENGNANINYNQKIAEIIGAALNEGEAKPTTIPMATPTPTVTPTEPEEPEQQEESVIFLLGEYNTETKTVVLEWYTNVTESAVTVWSSEDNAVYEQMAVVDGGSTYQYTMAEEWETRYFKASVADEQGNILETVPVVVTRAEDGYVMDRIDSDEDGLADEYEALIGTDANKTDTDGDGLTDYEEFYFCGTDPVIYDSVVKGASDAQADSDEDKLVNWEELNYSTDVQKADTDNDGLTDYEEIKLYNTDPLKTDTDGDGIPDGDELSLGLDPKNPATHGVPDAEYKVEQEIPAESKALEKINTEENPYRLSVEVKASGYVEGSLEAKETKYAAALENEFMVGVASELSCTNEDGIEEVTLSFEIDEAYIDNAIGLFPEAEELSGIKRFNVFKYFEDLNMLLPIETEVDVENNCIYATTDELGTYCVMDMELWLASFDVPEEVYQEATTFFMATERTTENSGEGEIRCDINGIAKEITEIEKIVPVADVRQDKTMLFTLNREAAVTPIDVVFLLQSSGQLPETFDSQKAMLVDLLSVLNEQYGEENVRFRVIMYNLSGVEMLASESGELWYADDSKLASALANIEYQYTSDYTVRGGAFEALQSVEFKENASKFAVQIMNGSTLVGATYFQQINSCVQLGINYSELIPEGYVYSNPDYKQQVEAAIASTNGMSVIYRSNTPQVLYDHIVAYTVSPQTEFDAIVPTGWKHIVLDGVLDPDNGVNSDTDELTDWEEIDTERICWEEGGTIILPTIQECIEFAEEPYAKDGLARFKTTKQVPGMPSSDFYKYLDYVLNSTRVLPIFSDPTAEDSDGDGWADHEDSSPLKVNTNLDEEMSQALIDALNDYLNQIMPPVYNENGEKITSKNRKCVATWNHFNEYIWPVLVENGTRPEGRLAAYTAWLREAYGLYGAEKFWLTLDGYVDTFYYELVNFEETIDRAVNQIIFGNYSEDVSLTGTAGQVTLSFLGVDFVADIRDITYDIDHWEFTWKHAGQTACDMVALLPVIGTLKHSDEFTSLAKVSKAKSVEYLDEFTVTANQMSLLGKNYDEITTAGKIALRSKKIELVTEQISTIANKYDNFKCVECAGDIRKFLKNNGEEFEVLDINLKNVQGISVEGKIIWSDIKGKRISENGFHTGTLYNSKVYDNIYPEGVSLEEWLSDFQIIIESGTVDLWQLYENGVFNFN